MKRSRTFAGFLSEKGKKVVVEAELVWTTIDGVNSITGDALDKEGGEWELLTDCCCCLEPTKPAGTQSAAPLTRLLRIVWRWCGEGYFWFAFVIFVVVSVVVFAKAWLIGWWLNKYGDGGDDDESDDDDADEGGLSVSYLSDLLLFV
jgi:hypothetical protein